MKEAFRRSHLTPPKAEACRRSLRAIIRHLEHIEAAEDRGEVVSRLVKIRLIAHNLSLKPGLFEAGQEDAFGAVLRACRKIGEYYAIPDRDVAALAAAQRPDWQWGLAGEAHAAVRPPS